ncbi:MAG: tyrosine--tRNA ligase [Deltaproteobacteria bacterium]|nr:tyrosine--tRNA ligase [Deltaproteobacteria bacterium]
MQKKWDLEEAFETLKLGATEILLETELKAKLANSLKTGKPLKVKAGFDPTAPDLHLGHTVLINRMAKFQEMGHEVYFLIGDFTGMIGDPTGKSESRKALSQEEVNANAETYKQQVFKVLDPARTKVVFNSQWLGKMSPVELIKLAATHTVARMLERDDFSKRYKDGQPISIHEFLYPLLQGYDSVALHSDIELGGTDQKFNLLVGRELQRMNNQTPQTIIMNPLLEGTDGVNKMSKSLGNYIAINDSSQEMFGKIMRISDELMLRYYELIGMLSFTEFERLKGDLRSGKLHPKIAKVNLAKTIVARFHSMDSANREAEQFEKVFTKGGLPDNIPEKKFSLKSLTPATSSLLAFAVPELVESNSQLRRLCEQGAVSVNGEKISDPKFAITSAGEYMLKVGKRGYLKLIVEK